MGSVRSRQKQLRWLIGGFLAVVLIPRPAHAYVDPGVLGVVYQFLYVVLLGGVAAFILRPWNYLKSRFGKATDDPPDSETESVSRGTAGELGDPADSDERS